jgi:hypothetical protein
MNYCAIGNKMTQESEAEGEKEKERICASAVDGESGLWLDLSQEDRELEKDSYN